MPVAATLNMNTCLLLIYRRCELWVISFVWNWKYRM